MVSVDRLTADEQEGGEGHGVRPAARSGDRTSPKRHRSPTASRGPPEGVYTALENLR